MSRNNPTTQRIDLDIVCQSCDGTGLYVGLAERDGAAVVCTRCTGSGKDRYHFSYQPFEARQPAPEGVTRVYVARGYTLSPNHPSCNGGVPIAEYTPGMIVPADEALYCPLLYTRQEWCSKPDERTFGSWIQDCPKWPEKADCWRIFHADAPATAKEQVA